MTGFTKNGYKQQIAEQFGQAAITYNVHATLQKRCAAGLLNLIEIHQDRLPAGAILEIGCGTGFITQGLIQKFSRRSLEITDLSPEMLEFCRSNLLIPDDQQSLISFRSIDAERIENSAQKYAAIVGGFVIQWFTDPVKSLRQLIDQLYPQGMLFLSFPTCDSFPEWRQVCQQLSFPCTANPLPDPDVLLAALPAQAQLCEMEVIEQMTTHVSAADFFRAMKAIGAGVNQSQKRLTHAQMKTLIRYWDGQMDGNVVVHHQIACCVIQRIL